MTDSLLDNTQKLQLFLGFLATAALVWLVWFFTYFGVSIKSGKSFINGVSIKSVKSFIKGVRELLLATLSLTYICLYALVQIVFWIVIIGVAVLLVVGFLFIIIKGVKFAWNF